MSETMILSVAVLVFLMLVIGLGLTILEFRYGQPRREAKRAREADQAPVRESTRDPIRWPKAA